jgi:hypothetical protein
MRNSLDRDLQDEEMNSMRSDMSAQILVGYIGSSILFALASPYVPIAFSWLADMPTVNTLLRHGAERSEILAYFSLMWCLLPVLLVAMMIWSPPPTSLGLRSGWQQLLLFSMMAVLAIPLFVWILCFFNPIAAGPRVKAMLFLSTHYKIGLGLFFGLMFDGLLILLFGILFAFPRLWLIRMKKPI